MQHILARIVNKRIVNSKTLNSLICSLNGSETQNKLMSTRISTFGEKERRNIYTTTNNRSNNKDNENYVTVVFVHPNGNKTNTKGKIGDTLLDVVVNNDVDLDGFGACEGSLACSTCHLIFKKQDFDKIGEGPYEEELDLLDYVYGLTETSRLGCQVHLTKQLDPLEVIVPRDVNDARI